jgi:hypothetical protein
VERVIQAVRSGLRTSGLRVDDDTVSDWTTAVLGTLGDGVVPKRLFRAFTKVDQEMAAKKAAGVYVGKLTPGDVCVAYRSMPVVDVSPVEDPSCQWACRDGLMEMLEPDGVYECVIPCSCEQGVHRKRTQKVFEGSRNVDELNTVGWRVRRR